MHTKSKLGTMPFILFSLQHYGQKKKKVDEGTTLIYKILADFGLKEAPPWPMYSREMEVSTFCLRTWAAKMRAEAWIQSLQNLEAFKKEQHSIATKTTETRNAYPLRAAEENPFREKVT